MDEKLVLTREIEAWRRRFPEFEYRPQDECVSLKLDQVRYGCHADLDDGMEPDGCVLDEKRACDCVYAGILEKAGKGKHECDHWKPIVMVGTSK